VAKEVDAKESDSQLLYSTLSRALAAHAFCARVRSRYTYAMLQAKATSHLLIPFNCSICFWYVCVCAPTPVEGRCMMLWCRCTALYCVFCTVCIVHMLLFWFPMKESANFSLHSLQGTLHLYYNLRCIVVIGVEELASILDNDSTDAPWHGQTLVRIHSHRICSFNSIKFVSYLLQMKRK
jgi:hypothetical protein